MDWPYLFGLNPENLADDEKDDLYNTVVWCNTDDEELSNPEKVVHLFKISQEVLKYKAEQVEVLLHKLDELAIQQAEEQARGSDGTDAKSPKSFKSSSLEFENLEQKFLELKGKYKKQMRLNDKNAKEIAKLQKENKNLEKERNRLITEMHAINQDDNQSEMSETIKEQHKELLDALQAKNKQISELLGDIEETESENSVLRDKLANVRDELANASQEIVNLTSQTQDLQEELNSAKNMLKKISVENESFQEEINEIQAEKLRLKKNIKGLTQEINARVDAWKKMLDEKEQEIVELRAQNRQNGSPNSIASDQTYDVKNPTQSHHIIALKELLQERENHLIELKGQLQDAINEMDESTKTMQNLVKDISDKERHIANLTENQAQLKKQLKTAHGRCQDLQEELAAAEKECEIREFDFNNLMEKLKTDGKIELAELLEEINALKTQNLAHEKQIISLVKTSNKLQDYSDNFEKENEILRQRCGIHSDEEIVPIKYKKKSAKKMATLEKRLRVYEDEQIQLKMENRSLKRRFVDYSDEKSEIDPVIEISAHRGDGDGKMQEIVPDNQIRALVEENEALRKGMHEILHNLNTKKETSTKELKSETFEKLLRALDVKHISGWYHPAMRLQAELHNLEGINSELREQLRLVRLDNEELKQQNDEKYQSDFPPEINNLISIDNIYKGLEGLLSQVNDKSSEQDEIEAKLIVYRNNFVQIQQQMKCLYEEYVKERQLLVDKISEYEERIQEIEENCEVQEKQLDLYQKEHSGDELLEKCMKQAENEVILSRKCDYFKNELKNGCNQLNSLQNEYSDSQNACIKKINELSEIKATLENKVAILEQKAGILVDFEQHNKLKTEFDLQTIKYRNLLTDFNKLSLSNNFEVEKFQEINRYLKEEKAEMLDKIANLAESLYKKDSNTENNDELAQKLSKSEINELNERQRANHTNNLFELVKEQLQKSEERFKQLEQYSKEILERNVLLQEQLKDAENRLIDSLDKDAYKNLLNKLNQEINEKEKLTLDLIKERNKLEVFQNENGLKNSWNNEKEDELLSLKHQIVDLQAQSDEKMQIARLGSELTQCRLIEAESKRLNSNLSEELRKASQRCEELLSELKFREKESLDKEVEWKKKASLLRELLSKTKLQYFGCVPLHTDESLVKHLKQTIEDKHAAFLKFYNAEILTNESLILKEQYEKGCGKLKQLLDESLDADKVRETLNEYQEKKLLQFNEVKYRRQFELKETQLKHVFDRVKIQDEQIIKLEEELFKMHKNVLFDCLLDLSTAQNEQPTRKNSLEVIKVAKSKETQTELIEPLSINENLNSDAKNELINARNDILRKEEIIQTLNAKLNECENHASLTRKQLADKQSQITFYERHILELQNNKIESVAPNPTNNGKSTSLVEPINNAEELMTLKCSLKLLEANLKHKEEENLSYQSLLKEDRDKHSMAAALMREELSMLQKSLNEERQKVADIKSSMSLSHPSKAALEQYFNQVHALEDELSDFRTKVSSLESQLSASRQEAVRWRVLANDRLESMQKLGNDLEELHRNEIATYKNDSEKWREEVTTLKHLIGRYRTEIDHEFDFKKLLQDKDERIHELSTMMRHKKYEAMKSADKSVSVAKLNELELEKEQLLKEHETIKKRFEQLLAREKNARDEIRDLKAKLMKKPLSARSDKSDKSVKDQLQKKITALEAENGQLKEHLTQQIVQNEAHRARIAANFDQWNKQKYWQQTAEKLKTKLKMKEADFDKLQQTCSGYRVLIERFEREKYAFENKIKSLKSGGNVGTSLFTASQQLEMLRNENLKLIAENEILIAKFEMQQHHAGALGAAMLQEKLEGQERKIAILELTSKTSLEVRAEMERLHGTNATLQKQNLRLEAENLDLRLDLEKTAKEIPHLREQIQHLENYIEVLKKENSEVEKRSLPEGLTGEENNSNKRKNASELERTVLVLKRVVEKLQAENKRLLSGKRPCRERTISADKLRRDHQRLKEDYLASLKKVEKLEEEIKHSKQSEHMENSAELVEELREELEQKSHLLAKVKVLLQRAAVKEKSLLQQINDLQASTSGLN